MDALDERIVKLERPVGFSIVAALLSFTAISTVLFWALHIASTNGSAVSEPSIYLAWKRPFPLAEAWMALTAIAAAIGLLRMKDWGLLFGCLAGSALIFLGLANMMFCVQNNLYTSPDADTIIQAAVHIWCLTFGPFVIAYLWGKRRWFFLM